MTTQTTTQLATLVTLDQQLAEQQLDVLYRAGERPRLVTVPRLTFLAVDGSGDPNVSAHYAGAVQALFSLSYGLKFALRRAGLPDRKVSPLEGLWWSTDLSDFPAHRDRWQWTAMIRQPDEVTPELLARTIREVSVRHPLPALREVRLFTFSEGLCAQLLHVGPYAAEGPSIARLHAFIAERDATFDGHVQRHHEIYLGDPRRTAPARLRTILRQPITLPRAR